MVIQDQQEGEVPPIFKALTSISAWILFVAGCGNFIITLVTFAVGGVAAEEWKHIAAFIAIATASVIFPVVAMKLRQMLE